MKSVLIRLISLDLHSILDFFMGLARIFHVETRKMEEDLYCVREEGVNRLFNSWSATEMQIAIDPISIRSGLSVDVAKNADPFHPLGSFTGTFTVSNDPSGCFVIFSSIAIRDVYLVTS